MEHAQIHTCKYPRDKTKRHTNTILRGLYHLQIHTLTTTLSVEVGGTSVVLPIEEQYIKIPTSYAASWSHGLKYLHVFRH